MAFTCASVTLPSNTGTLVYSTPAGVPTEVGISVGGGLLGNVFLLDSSGQSSSAGFELQNTITVISGLVGSIYAIQTSGASATINYYASNIA